MARIKLQKPQEYIFTSTQELTINFINYGGHMGNDAILTLCQEARIKFLKSLSFSELNFFGKSLIQSDAAIVFKNEAFHGDLLSIKLSITDENEYGFDFFYQISNQEDNDIAYCKTGMVFFDYNNRKVSRAPKKFIDYLKSLS